MMNNETPNQLNMTVSEIKAKQIIDMFGETIEDKHRLHQFLTSFKNSIIKETSEKIANRARQELMGVEENNIVKEINTYCREIL